MLMAAATRRASWRSSIEQQLPNEVCPSLWSYSCIDSPMTSCPCSSSRAAATDESTPPDIATTIRIVMPATAFHEVAKGTKVHEENQSLRVLRGSSSLRDEPSSLNSRGHRFPTE